MLDLAALSLDIAKLDKNSLTVSCKVVFLTCWIVNVDFIHKHRDWGEDLGREQFSYKTSEISNDSDKTL